MNKELLENQLQKKPNCRVARGVLGIMLQEELEKELREQEINRIRQIIESATSPADWYDLRAVLEAQRKFLSEKSSHLRTLEVSNLEFKEYVQPEIMTIKKNIGYVNLWIGAIQSKINKQEEEIKEEALGNPSTYKVKVIKYYLLTNNLKAFQEKMNSFEIFTKAEQQDVKALLQTFSAMIAEKYTQLVKDAEKVSSSEVKVKINEQIAQYADIIKIVDSAMQKVMEVLQNN